MSHLERAVFGCLVLLAGATPALAAAQSASAREGQRAITRCDYSSCALSIAPTWNGLSVVRGINGDRVANLNFFWPGDIRRAMVGSDAAAPGLDSALAQARRAVRIRRIGAALTDAGVALAVTAAVRAARAGRLGGSDAMIAGAAAASLGLSIPFQFAADGALSRAVWWHNLRYSP